MRAHRHGMRVLVVRLDWSGLLRASLAQLGVLVAHPDQSAVAFGVCSTVARGGRGRHHCAGGVLARHEQGTSKEPAKARGRRQEVVRAREVVPPWVHRVERKVVVADAAGTSR